MKAKKIVEEMTGNGRDEKIIKEFSKRIKDLQEKFNRSQTKEKVQLLKKVEKILDDNSPRVAVKPKIKE